MPFFESFVIFNVLKVEWVANVNNFLVILRYFILIVTYVAMSLKNQTFLRPTQKHFSFFNYWKKFGESVSLLVRFVFFTDFHIHFSLTKLVYLL